MHEWTYVQVRVSKVRHTKEQRNELAMNEGRRLEANQHTVTLGFAASKHFNGVAIYLVACTQSALEFFPIHCPNGRLWQGLGFDRFAFALKLPELLNTNLAAVRAKLGQTSCFPNGPQIWCPIGQ